MTEKRKRKEPHKRPTAEQMDERVKLPDDPAKVIEAILNVDPNAPETDEPKPRQLRRGSR